jgi:hypothetical protein
MAAEGGSPGFAESIEEHRGAADGTTLKRQQRQPRRERRRNGKQPIERSSLFPWLPFVQSSATCRRGCLYRVLGERQPFGRLPYDGPPNLWVRDIQSATGSENHRTGRFSSVTDLSAARTRVSCFPCRVGGGGGFSCWGPRAVLSNGQSSRVAGPGRRGPCTCSAECR